MTYGCRGTAPSTPAAHTPTAGAEEAQGAAWGLLASAATLVSPAALPASSPGFPGHRWGSRGWGA